MNYIEIIQDALEYIEQHLNRELRADELAARYYMSPTHFYRIFRAVTNKTVKAYVDARRLSEAAKELLAADRKMIDIALQYGYQSHESFTRGFTRMFGVTPTRYKKNGRLEAYYAVPHIAEREFRNVNKDVIVDFVYETIPDTRLVGREIRFHPERAEDISRATEFVAAFVEAYITPTGITRLYNVTRTDPGYPGEISYFTGFVPPDEAYETVLDELRLPASRYAAFQYRGGMGSVFQTATVDLFKAISVSRLQLHAAGIELFEMYEQDYEQTGLFKIYVPVL